MIMFSYQVGTGMFILACVKQLYSFKGSLTTFLFI